jgi:predicted HTH transcriptional regulator
MLMRIFLNMNLTEHTGHGIPAILAKYGEEAFDIGDSYIMVTIPFDKAVLNIASRKQNVGTNVGLNVGLNATEKKVIALILENQESTASEMANAIGVTKRTVERTLKKLQEKGIIVRTGTKKSGQWIVIK